MTHLFTFVILAFLLVLLPGPDYVMITKNTLKDGTQAGMRTLFGTCTALCAHTTFAVVGLSAIIVKSAFLFSTFKIIGAVYLFYLGVKALLSMRKISANSLQQTEKETNTKQEPNFRQGFLTNLLNPKVAVFFLTFLPQLVNPNENTLISFTLLGVIYILITFTFFVVYVLLINRIKMFMEKESTQKAIQCVSGIVLIAFGVKLALEKA
jgi:RhtB (resistance to homoserine/threonine) family protein